MRMVASQRHSCGVLPRSDSASAISHEVLEARVRRGQTYQMSGRSLLRITPRWPGSRSARRRSSCKECPHFLARDLGSLCLSMLLYGKTRRSHTYIRNFVWQANAMNRCWAVHVSSHVTCHVWVTTVTVCTCIVITDRWVHTRRASTAASERNHR